MLGKKNKEMLQLLMGRAASVGVSGQGTADGYQLITVPTPGLQTACLGAFQEWGYSWHMGKICTRVPPVGVTPDSGCKLAVLFSVPYLI